MRIRIKKAIHDEVENPVMLAAWPGQGSVGVGALNYLRRNLNAEAFAEVDLSEFFAPEAIVVEKGIVRSFSDIPSHTFYYVRRPSLIIFESEAQVSGQGGVALMNQIMDLADDLGVRKIYTAAAYAQAVRHSDPVRVLGAANKRELRDSLAEHKVEILKEGQISGLNGLLLGTAGLRDVSAACLLATMPLYAQMMPNPRASRAVINTLMSILDVQVDLDELDEAVDQMDGMMAEIENKIRSTFSSLEEEEEAGELEEIDEERLPEYVMERIERLFAEVDAEGSKAKAAELKEELDRWNLYSLYEDRFLGLFRQDLDT